MKASCTTSVCLHKKPSPQARRKDIRNEMYHYFCGQTVRCRTSDRSTSWRVTARNSLRKKRRYLHCCQLDESYQRQSLGLQPASPHILRYPDRYRLCTTREG